MTNIKEENLLENGKEYFDKVIPLKEEYDKGICNSVILDQIFMIFTSYHESVMCINGSAILSMIDNEIKARKIKTKRINKSCERAIANLEIKISNPEGYMEDALWRTRSFYNKRRILAVDSASNNTHSSKKDISYSLKGN